MTTVLGLTSVVAGDSYYITIFIVVMFHQFFEGVALGTVIADLPLSATECAPNERAVSLVGKLLVGLPYALVTPAGMAIGIGALNSFNGNNPSTIIAIGTLDALSAGILVWVGIVEMWAKDWFGAGELATASVGKASAAMVGLILGLVVMSVLGKWI